MANYVDLLGTPFKYGGRGDGFYDCYGLVKELLHRDGIEVPDYLSPSSGPEITAMMMGELRLWEKTPIRPGAIHMFRVPGNVHVAYAISNDSFVHTWEDSGGVLVERLSDGWDGRLMGTYRYVG